MLSPEALEFLKSKGVFPDVQKKHHCPTSQISTQQRVSMVSEMQKSGEDLSEYHLEHMEDRRVNELYLEREGKDEETAG